jgi:hypothetical protein
MQYNTHKRNDSGSLVGLTQVHYLYYSQIHIYYILCNAYIHQMEFTN